MQNFIFSIIAWYLICNNMKISTNKFLVQIQTFAKLFMKFAIQFLELCSLCANIWIWQVIVLPIYSFFINFVRHFNQINWKLKRQLIWVNWLILAKTLLQSRFTLLKSKFFPAKFPFSKIQKKNLAGKKNFAK
jgi:hypothetical protein